MKDLGTIKLETDRLILRRFEVSDAADMYQNWADDEEVTRYLVWPTHTSVNMSKAYIESLTESYDDPRTYSWGIELKSISQVIGSMSVVRRDDQVQSMHIGYCIGRRWWNQGITSEALRAVIDFLMNEVGINKIDSRHDPRNLNSGKVMLKCGMKYEGTLRASDVNNQGICDAAWYGLLRDEYMQKKMQLSERGIR